MSYTKAMFEDQIIAPVLKITNKSLEDNDYSDILNKIDIVLDILEEIKKINPKIIDMWNEITSDILASIYSASSGFYRHAIIALRSTLELACSSLYYIDHEIEYEMFIKYNMKADKYVSTLVNEYYFFTTKYISVFYSDIETVQTTTDSVSTYLKKLYGDLSDVVHGRYNSLTKINKLSIEYRKDEFKKFETLLNKVLSIICVMYIFRTNDFSNESIVRQAKLSGTVKI